MSQYHRFVGKHMGMSNSRIERTIPQIENLIHHNPWRACPSNPHTQKIESEYAKMERGTGKPQENG
jgi:hypothetical protein